MNTDKHSAVKPQPKGKRQVAKTRQGSKDFPAEGLDCLRVGVGAPPSGNSAHANSPQQELALAERGRLVAAGLSSLKSGGPSYGNHAGLEQDASPPRDLARGRTSLDRERLPSAQTPSPPPGNHRPPLDFPAAGIRIGRRRVFPDAPGPPAVPGGGAGRGTRRREGEDRKRVPPPCARSAPRSAGTAIQVGARERGPRIGTGLPLRAGRSGGSCVFGAPAPKTHDGYPPLENRQAVAG